MQSQGFVIVFLVFKYIFGRTVDFTGEFFFHWDSLSPLQFQLEKFTLAVQ